MATEFRKIQIGFDAEAYESLQRLRRRTGAITIAEVVRQALGLYEWAIEEADRGASVGSHKEGEPRKEIVILRGMRGMR